MKLQGIVTLPGGEVAEFTVNDSVVVHAVDATGTYIGLQPLESKPLQVPSAPPPGEHWRWRSDRWVQELPPAELRTLAVHAIDSAAGVQRLRYISDTAGQALTDFAKQQQATAYLADPRIDVPALVQAEADAMQIPVAEAALYIRDEAARWEVAAAAIERERRRGQVAVQAATDAAAVQAALDAALAALADLEAL